MSDGCWQRPQINKHYEISTNFTRANCPLRREDSENEESVIRDLENLFQFLEIDVVFRSGSATPCSKINPARKNRLMNRTASR